MANIIDILINAKWTGGGAIKGATGDMRAMGNTATSTSVELAAAGQKTALLNNKMAELGQEVALGTKTTLEATHEYNQFSDSLGAVGAQAPRTGTNLAGMTTKIFAMTAAIGAAVITAKKFGDFIRSGAELENMEIRFDRLAESIGTTSEALKSDLRVAIQGLATEAQSIALATDLLALGLAKSHDEAVRLASVSAQLGFDMNQLVLTLTNQTTMRFDALGVAVDGFEDKVKKLEEAGLDANEAFKLAFLEQSEEQIERVGSRAETTAGQLDILSAAWSDTVDSFKEGITTGLGPVIEVLISAYTAAIAAETAFDDLGKAGNFSEQVEAVEALRDALNDLSTKGQFGIGLQQNSEKAYKALLDTVVALAMTGETAEEQRAILESFGFDVDDNRIKLDKYSVSWEDLAAAIEQVELKELQDSLERTDEKMAQLSESTVGVVSGMAELSPEVQRLADDLAELIEKSKELDAEQFLEDAGVSIETFAGVLESFKGDYAATFDFFEAVGRDVGQVTDDLGQSIEELAKELDPDRFKKRASLWEDFQDDLTSITDQASEQRAQVEERYESQRTETVERYSQRRAQEEEDWQRSRARQEADFRRSLDDVRADSAERQIELRADTNNRLATLEQDHLERMRDIIDSADLQIAEAASRLDANAVAAITRQREQALADEKSSYQKQYKDINKQLELRLKAEQESAAERIEEMTEFHERRKQQEAEDRQIRLERLQAAHDEQLRELEQQRTDRLNQITQQAAEERAAREQQYIDERTRLADHWGDRAQLEETWMNYLLQQEEQFWRNRLGLVGGGDVGTVGDGGEPDTTGGGGDDGTTQDKPSRAWLENTALRVANPGDSEQAFTWIRWIKTKTDAELARWIEQNSDIDVPGYALGTLSALGGLALVGEDGPELVNLPQGAQVFPNDITANLFAKAAGGVNVGDVTIIVEGADSPEDTAVAVRREMTALFEEMAR